MSEEEVQEEAEEVDLRAKLEKLVKNNVEIENALIQSGVRPNAFVIASMRLDLLLEQIYPDEEQRLLFEIESAKRVHGILMHIQADVQAQKAEKKLLLPDPKLQAPPGGLIPK